VTVSPADSSATNEELMSDTVLTLSFTHYEYIRLKVNDYVDFLGKRYWLLKNYRPVKKSSIEYQYDVKFYGIESKPVPEISLLFCRLPLFRPMS